jgi:hypothetical protein
MRFRVQPDLFERGNQSGFAAWQQRTARPVRDADGSITLRFARDVVPGPGRCSKCADARCRNAGGAASIALEGGGPRIGAVCEVPGGYMALASHSGSCEHRCGDQRSRQNFSLSHFNFSVGYEKPMMLAPLWRWRGDRQIKVTFPRVASTLREIGAQNDHKGHQLLTTLHLSRARSLANAMPGETAREPHGASSNPLPFRLCDNRTPVI